MSHIDYFFATVSPFTYLAGTRLEEIAQVNGATITYKPVAIMDLFARTGGTAPKDRHPARQEYRLQEMRRQSSMTGLPINLKPAHWPTNPAPSSYAIIAAQQEGGGDLGALVHGLCRACWNGEEDIAQDEVIRGCLSRAGFDEGLADRGLMNAADEYARNLEEAVERGVFGAPFYIVTDSDERFWGQDRLADLETFLDGNL